MNDIILIPEDTLSHSGVKGMKWGVVRWRDWQKQRQRKASLKKARETRAKNLAAKKKAAELAAKRANDPNLRAKDMTDDELRARIARLQLEKSYKDLVAATTPQAQKKAKSFLADIAEKTAKDVGTKAANYALSRMVNEIAGEEVISLPGSEQKKAAKAKAERKRIAESLKGVSDDELAKKLKRAAQENSYIDLITGAKKK